MTLVPLAAELMEALKLREPARVSLQLPPEGALGLFLAITERWGGQDIERCPHAGQLPGRLAGNGTVLSLCKTDQGCWVAAGAEGLSGGTCLCSFLWVRNQLSPVSLWAGCVLGAVLRAPRDTMPSADRAAGTRGFL